MNTHIRHFFDPKTSTLSYIVYDEITKDAVFIDPVWEIDLPSGTLSHKCIEPLISFAKEANLNPLAIIETHIHADHISGAQLLKKHFPKLKTVIGSRISEVQKVFHKLYDMTDAIAINGSQFDILAKDGEEIQFGSIKAKAIQTPGHTPACTSYLINNSLFTGDSIFMPDSGTGRCDFPGGDAEALFNSITKKIYALPDDTHIFVGHDYQPGGRGLKFQTSVKEQKEQNVHIKSDTKLETFLEFRRNRDAQLSAPNLLYPSIQINMNGGVIPFHDSAGKAFLKIPLNIKN